MTKSRPLQTVTFGQLAQALALLGFERREVPEFTMFRNTDFDAVITLPREDASSPLRSLHLAAARATVAGKGIAPPADFDRLVVQMGQDVPPVSGEALRAVSTRTADVAGPKKRAKKTGLQAV